MGLWAPFWDGKAWRWRIQKNENHESTHLWKFNPNYPLGKNLLLFEEREINLARRRRFWGRCGWRTRSYPERYQAVSLRGFNSYSFWSNFSYAGGKSFKDKLFKLLYSVHQWTIRLGSLLGVSNSLIIKVCLKNIGTRSRKENRIEFWECLKWNRYLYHKIWDFSLV